ncbi:MAG TPA: acyl-CoA dehydrogenase family protein [Acidimicrobiales bacterium]
MIDYSSLESTQGQDWYALDPELQAQVRRHCPPDDLRWSEAKLGELGRLVGAVIGPNAETIDAHPPELVRYDRWANEIDRVVHHPAMLESKRALWNVGYAGGFAADEAARGRPVPGAVRMAAGYLVSQADTGLVCSIGMTSGVAGLVEAYAPPEVVDALLPRLRAGDMDEGADGSMFLTERDGGSDLGHTVHCTARELGDGRVLINGEKWFCSNIDGAAIVMLARPEGAPEGSRGLGLYLVPRELDDGTRNHIVMRRLKPKLGTRSVPTGEVEFRDALAYALRPRRAGEAGDSDAGGLNRMMEMVNGSRFGVALMGLGIARRSFLESAIWSYRRSAKGRLLVDLPLVREQLVDLAVEVEAGVALAMECAAAPRQQDAARLRRILIPATKVAVCRLGVEAASAAVELHGGNGYCEDWGLTRQLRDAQCHPIWEGTEHICSLDVLRAMRQDAAHEAVLARVDAVVDRVRGGPALVGEVGELVGAANRRLAARADEVGTLDPDRAEARSGRLSWLLARTAAAALLLEQAVTADPAGRSQDAAGYDIRKALVALRFARRHLAPEDVWGDRIAAEAGREILSFAEVDEASATKAAA